MKTDILDEQHWVYANYKQRILTKQWRELLLNNDDRLIFQGRMYQLKGDSVGHGVVEVSKEVDNEYVFIQR